MKKTKWAEVLVGGALILAGGVDFMATTIPGAIILADGFGVKL